MVRRWDRFRDPWDREYAMRGRLWSGRAHSDWMIPHLGPNARVLEVGCGNGKTAGAIARTHSYVVASDRSRHSLRLAREDGLSRILLADARYPPHPDGGLDAVVARHVLGAMLKDDRRLAAQALWALVAPGGALLVEEFSSTDFRSGRGRPVEEGTVERNHGIYAHYFDRTEIEALVPATGDVSFHEWSQATSPGISQPRATWRAVWVRIA